MFRNGRNSRLADPATLLFDAETNISFAAPKAPGPTLAHAGRISLVRLKRLDGSTYGDCKRLAPGVKPLAPVRRDGRGFTCAFLPVVGV